MIPLLPTNILSPYDRVIILKFKSDQVIDGGKGFQQVEALDSYDNPGLRSSGPRPGRLVVAKMMVRVSCSHTL